MARRKAKRFCVIVEDRSKKVFSVEGPMSDDTALTHAVAEAQKTGRQVWCHSMGDVDPETAAAEWLTGYGHQRQVPAGSILDSSN